MRESVVASIRMAGLCLMLFSAGTSAIPREPPAQTPPADNGSPALATLSAELSTVIPAGSRVWVFAVGDADGDGDEEVAAVLSIDDTHQPRPLLLLRRGADGRLRIVVESPRAIPCYECGGMTGDPLQGIRIEPGTLTLRFEGGSRELWSSEFQFAPAPGGDGWRLTGVTHRGFDLADGRNAERVLSMEEIGDVSLAAFDASAFQADALH